MNILETIIGSVISGIFAIIAAIIAAKIQTKKYRQKKPIIDVNQEQTNRIRLEKIKYYKENKIRLNISNLLNNTISYIRKHFRTIVLTLIVSILVFLISFFGINYILAHTLKEPQLSHILFNLSNGPLQKRALNESGQIYLSSHDLKELNSLSGKAVFNNFHKSDNCEIWARTKYSKKIKISSDSCDGYFSFNLRNQNYGVIYLTFKINHKEILATIIIK